MELELWPGARTPAWLWSWKSRLTFQHLRVPNSSVRWLTLSASYSLEGIPISNKTGSWALFCEILANVVIWNVEGTNKWVRKLLSYRTIEDSGYALQCRGSLGEKAPGSLFLLSESGFLSLSFGPFSAQLKSQVINLHLLSRLRSFALFS